MKQWYVPLADLTDEQEAEIVRLMKEKQGYLVIRVGSEDCLGANGEPVLHLDYWFAQHFHLKEKVTFEEAKELLS